MENVDYRWPLFWPHISKELFLSELEDTFSTRWIGQGPKGDKFEKEFEAKFGAGHALAVSSGTAALHLSYVLAGIREGSNVISPVLTCTATNHALLQQKANIHFCDVDPSSLNPDPAHARQLCEKANISAIIAVHVGGDPCDIGAFLELGEEYRVPVIFDAAQALGAKYNGMFINAPPNCGFATCHSFQAIKHFTTGDGGMLTLPGDGMWQYGDKETPASTYSKAKRLRWFGIDREKKADNDWQPLVGRKLTTNQHENGYKYQMTDIAASLGLVGMHEIDSILAHRKQLSLLYRDNLEDQNGIELLRKDTDRWKSSNWLFGFLVDKREDFAKMMKSRGVEVSVVQTRNDLNDVFGGEKCGLPGMDKVEDQYIYLPLHTALQKEDVEQICDIVKKGW